MADVMLDLDADHASLISGALSHVLDEPVFNDEDRAVLAAVRDVIDRQLAPETMP